MARTATKRGRRCAWEDHAATLSIVFVGIAVTVAVTVVSYSLSAAAGVARLRASSTSVMDATVNHWNHIIEQIDTIARLMEAREGDILPADSQIDVASSAMGRYSGITGSAFARWVPHDQRAQWEARVSETYNSSIEITRVGLTWPRPTMPNESYYVAVETIVRTTSVRVVGLNLLSEPRRRATLAKGFGRNEVTISPWLTLIVDVNSPKSGLIQIPVLRALRYDNLTDADRAAALRPWNESGRLQVDPTQSADALLIGPEPGGLIHALRGVEPNYTLYEVVGQVQAALDQSSLLQEAIDGASDTLAARTDLEDVLMAVVDVTDVEEDRMRAGAAPSEDHPLPAPFDELGMSIPPRIPTACTDDEIAARGASAMPACAVELAMMPGPLGGSRLEQQWWVDAGMDCASPSVADAFMRLTSARATPTSPVGMELATCAAVRDAARDSSASVAYALTVGQRRFVYVFSALPAYWARVVPWIGELQVAVVGLLVTALLAASVHIYLARQRAMMLREKHRLHEHERTLRVAQQTSESVTAWVSHELRNPLFVVSALADMMEEDLRVSTGHGSNYCDSATSGDRRPLSVGAHHDEGAGSTATESMAIIGMDSEFGPGNILASTLRDVVVIRRSVSTMQRLVSDLLDLAKVKAGKLHISAVPVRVREFFPRLVEPFRAATPLPVELVMSDDLPLLMLVDPMRLEQVLSNGLSNACKYATEGSIDVLVDSVPDTHGLSCSFAGASAAGSCVADVRITDAIGSNHSPTHRAALDTAAAPCSCACCVPVGGAGKSPHHRQGATPTSSGGEIKHALSADEYPPLLRVRIRDQGPGLQGLTQARLFEPFTRVEDIQGRTEGALLHMSRAQEIRGTGLGLPIANQLAKAMGGRLSLRDNTTGHMGATYELVLPCALTPVNEEMAAAQSYTPVAQKEAGQLLAEPHVQPLAPTVRPHLGLHVLIVDDDATIRGTCARMLCRLHCTYEEEEHGMHVERLLASRGQLSGAAAGDDEISDTGGGTGVRPVTMAAVSVMSRGAAAAAAAASATACGDASGAGRPFDVVLQDIVMLDADGADMVGTLHAKWANVRVPFVAVTGNVQDTDCMRYAKAGFSAVMGKPYKMSDLQAVLEAMQRGEVGLGLPPVPTRGRGQPRT